MPTPTKRRSPAKSPSAHKSISQDLYEKEQSKADNFVNFMTSPSASKSVRSRSRDKDASPSPSKRFAKSPARTYSTRQSPLQKSRDTVSNEEKDEVLPLLAMESPPKRTPLWTDLEVAKTPAELASERKPKVNKRRGISPNSHGTAIARALSTPNTAKLVDDIVGRYISPRKRSSAEDALSNAHKRGKSHSSPRGRTHKASVLSGGAVNIMMPSPTKSTAGKTKARYSPLRHGQPGILMNRDSLPDLAKAEKSNCDSDTEVKAPSTARGRRSCPPKFYHDEVDIKDRESPSRFDSPSFGLLPAKKEKIDASEPKSKKANIGMKLAGGANNSTEKQSIKTETNSNKDGKKRRRSRARKHVAAGFSLGNIEDLENALKTPKVSPADKPSDESGKSKRRAVKKEIVSNKELEEMMTKKRKQSEERKKKAAAKKEAAKIAVRTLEADIKKQEGNVTQEKKDPPQGQENLIVQLLADSPSSTDKATDGKQPDKRDAILDEHINKYMSSGNTATLRQKKKSKSEEQSAKKALTTAKPESKDKPVINEDVLSKGVSNKSVPSIDATSNELQASKSAKSVSNKTIGVDHQPDSTDKASALEAKCSPSKKSSSQSPSRRGKRQMASSLEKVLQPKSTPESPSRRARRQEASSLETVPSPESPLRAKSLLSALHDDNPAPVQRIAASGSLDTSADKKVEIDFSAPKDDILKLASAKLPSGPEKALAAKQSIEQSLDETDLGTNIETSDMSKDAIASDESHVAVETSNSSKERRQAGLTEGKGRESADNETSKTAGSPAASTLDDSDSLAPVADSTVADHNAPSTTSELKTSPTEERARIAVGSQKSSPKDSSLSISQSSAGLLAAAAPSDNISRQVEEMPEVIQDAELVNLAPRVQLGNSPDNAQALIANAHLHNTIPGQMSSDQLQYQLMLAERQYQAKHAACVRYDSDFGINNERLRALNERMAGIDGRAAAIRTNTLYSPVHYESVSRMYHSEIISSKRRRYRPEHNEYSDHHHYSHRSSKHEQRLSGSKRGSSRKTKKRNESRRRYHDDSSESSDLEFGGSSLRSSKKHKYSARREDFSSSESELEQSRRVSRKRRDKEMSRCERGRDCSDVSDTKQSRRSKSERSKMEKSRMKRREESSGDSEDGLEDVRRSSHELSRKPEKTKLEQPRGGNIQKKSPRKLRDRSHVESPRRARARQTNSVLESVSPSRKQRNRVDSPRRAKFSQASVLEGVGSDSDTQNHESQAKSPNVTDPSKNDTKHNDAKLSNAPAQKDVGASNDKGENASFWLLGDSESDLDFDGPMILPPKPI